MLKKNIYIFNYICFINKNDFLQYIYFLIPTPLFLERVWYCGRYCGCGLKKVVL
jgi:hypothetical protein